MSNDNTPKEVEVSTDNLDDFNELLFGDAVEATPEKSEVEEQEETEETSIEDNSLANEDQSELDDESEEEFEEQSEAELADESEEDTPKPKKKKTTQERINEVYAKYKEEERKRELLEARLAERERINSETNKQEPTAAPAEVEALDTVMPTPDQKNEDGSNKYPLGEFDPSFVLDLTNYQFDIRERQAQEQAKANQEVSKQQLQQEQLQQNWQQKIATVTEDMPDFMESVANLETQFKSVEPTLSQYLADTIMEMDQGPEVLYYLSKNPEEANKIVNLGAKKATLELGRLEARFSSKETKPKSTKKVTNANAVPKTHTRGAGTSSGIAPDTDNLDDFEKLLWGSK